MMVSKRIFARTDKQHADVAIVFGSATNGSSRKPASVRATCEAIGLPRSTFYYQSHRSHSAVELEHKIVLRLHELRRHHPDEGYRRMTQLLQFEGFQVNRKRIARLMQLHCLGARPAKRSVSLRSQPPRAPLTNLLHSARISAPNQAWLADIAYVRVQSGLVYATVVIDAWLREVVGYAISLQISNRLASIALHTAVRAHRPGAGCIHHSTCGAQYFIRGYAKLIRAHGMTPSITSPFNGESPGSDQSTKPVSSRVIIEMPSYESWKEVTQRSREFIQTVYSRERVDALLHHHSTADPAPPNVPIACAARGTSGTGGASAPYRASELRSQEALTLRLCREYSLGVQRVLGDSGPLFPLALRNAR